MSILLIVLLIAGILVLGYAATKIPGLPQPAPAWIWVFTLVIVALVLLNAAGVLSLHPT